MRYHRFTKESPAFQSMPEPTAVTVLPIQFYIGETVTIEGPFIYNDTLVSPDVYIVEVIMKASPQDTCTIWTGTLDDGIYYTPSKPGTYKIVVPRTITDDIKPGTYWLDISITEKLGAIDSVVDKKILLSQIQIGLDYSAISNKTEGSYPKGVNIINV